MIRWLLVAALAVMPAAAMAAQPQASSIEARLQRVEDELAIRHILIEYARALDERDFDAYVGLFAKDGEWINGKEIHKGHDDIRKLLIGIFGKPQPGFVNKKSVEFVSNPDITLNGDHAKARSFHMLIWRGPDGVPQPTLIGRYDDEFIREDGQWKILRRVDNPVMPLPEEWAKVMAARNATAGTGQAKSPGQ